MATRQVLVNVDLSTAFFALHGQMRQAAQSRVTAQRVVLGHAAVAVAGRSQTALADTSRPYAVFSTPDVDSVRLSAERS